MKVKFLVLAGVAVAAVGFSRQVQANIVASTVAPTSWSGTPVYQTGAIPTSDSGGTTNDNGGWGGTGTGIGINGQGALAQLFEVTSAGTLSSAELTMAGSAATFNVELYDLGAPPAGYQSTPGNAAAVTALSGVNSGFISVNGGAYNAAPNLLASGDQFTFNGTATNTLQILSFQGADSGISLATGQLYMLSLDPVSNSAAAGAYWQRGGVPVAAYNTGEGLSADGNTAFQQFEGKTSVRDLDTAITESVPEPATLGLAAMTSVGLLIRRRRQNV